MIPAPFEYLRTSSVEECVDVLAQHGDDAKVLAGGHSLLPLMKLRFAHPELLIDIGRIEELRGVRVEGEWLVIGAATTHHEVIENPLVRRHCGILAEATAVVGDPQVRHRGTLGGALAHGDAAGDLPAVALALNATLIARSPRGRRSIAASDFFVDFLQTALAPDEVLTEIRVPRLDQGWTWRYEKFSRAAHMWAVVGSCIVVRVVEGHIADARIALANMGSVPMRAHAAEQALTGATVGAIRDAAALAHEGCDPPADINGQPDYRRQLATALTQRALEGALT